jgi:hypothetical protein
VEKAIGKYTLKIENDSHHGFANYIEISKIENNKVTGMIGIDWNLGPEARKPMDWEKLYEQSFVAELKGKDFGFAVDIAKEFKNVAAVYTFSLGFINAAGSYQLGGDVSIKSSAKNEKEANKSKVAAVKIEENT